MVRHFLSMQRFFVVLSFVSFITGCSSTPPTLVANLQAANYLNPDIYNHSSPVVVTIYQLKSSMAFQQANFFALNNNALNVLGGDLLDKQEVELRPKQAQTLKIPLSPATNYIGVVAAFRNPDHAQWRKLVKVEADGNVKLEISLATQNVIAKIK